MQQLIVRQHPDTRSDTANLTRANFSGATLQWVNFLGANLTRANLKGANLSAGSIGNAARLRDVNLTGVIWGNTTCPDGTVSNVQCAVLSVATDPASAPQKCTRTGTHASGCDLIAINVTGKDLSDADFRWC